MRFQPDAMPGAVHELAAIASRTDRLAGRGVHVLGPHPGAYRHTGRFLGVPEDLVVGGEVGGRLADDVRPGAIRAVPAGHGTADVDHDRVARAQHPAGRFVMRAGRVRPGRDDHEIGAGVALGRDRPAHVRGHVQLGPAGPQPARQRGVHPVDGRPGLAQRGDLGRRLALAQPAQRGRGQSLPGARQHVAEAQHHQGPHPVGQPDRAGRAEPPGDQLVRIAGLVPRDHLEPGAARGGRLGGGQFQPRHDQERIAGGRHREAGEPLQLLRVVPDHVAQVRPGGEQQGVQPGLGRGRGGLPQPPRRVELGRGGGEWVRHDGHPITVRDALVPGGRVPV